MLKRILVIVALVLSGTLALAAPAQAHSPSPNATWVSLGLYDGAGTFDGRQVWTSHSQLITPNHAYNNIDVVHVANCNTGAAAIYKVRTRFYPAGGGQYVNGWLGDGAGYIFNFHLIAETATGVQSGTHYKVEIVTDDGPVCMSLYH